MIALEKLCAEWQAEGMFWPWHEVQRSFEAGNILVLYSGEVAKLDACIISQIAFDECDLLFIYVSPPLRRSGVGQALFAEFVGHLRSQTSVQTVFLEVRQSNETAQRFYETLGMKPVAVRRKYYQNGEDAKIYSLGIR